MPPKIFTAFIVSAIIYLSACDPCYDKGPKVWCTPTGMAVEFIGYDSAQLSTICISQFVQGSNFANVLATDTYSLVACPQHPCSGYFWFYNDTAYLPAQGPGRSFTPGHDYEIIIPSIKVIKISNIVAKSEWGCEDGFSNGFYCPITSFEMDGVTTSSGECIYIYK